jgi:hypothetical protein
MDFDEYDEINTAVVGVEVELDKLRDEREEKENSAPATGATATGKKSGCGCLAAIFYFFLGILLFTALGELLFIFSK